MKDFRILPEVADDVTEAADWYDKESFAGLGDRFLETFYASIAHLQKTGEIHRTVYSDFRRIFLRPFSYALYYRYHGELLTIAGGNWFSRCASVVNRLPIAFHKHSVCSPS